MSAASVAPLITTCDMCGHEDVCAWEYACLPHVAYPACCSSCAVEIVRSVMADADATENAVIPQDTAWYLRHRATPTL